MRKSLWIVLALLVVGLAQVARADTTKSFNFTGNLTEGFTSGDSVTGSFTLDLTTATITAFDFSTPFLTVDVSNNFSAGIFTDTTFVGLEFVDNQANSLSLWFLTSLASFSGNTFFTGLVLFPFPMEPTQSQLCLSGCIISDSFTSGSATPVTTAAEPASFLLLGSGLLGLAGIKRRRSGC
jgi:hypothetical protein